MAVEQRLYQLIRQPKPIADRRFEIECLDSGVVTFPFTFGSRLAINQLRTRRQWCSVVRRDPRYETGGFRDG